MLKSAFATGGVLAPLKLPVYRGSWAASLVSNSAMMLLGVGAGWAMTQMTNAADQVALVQTALMLPVAIFALPAGAVADMFDRRSVAMSALAVACLAAALLVACAVAHELTPLRLLAFCFVVAGGAAVFNPAWQASVNDQVPHELMPAAVSLSSISYNIARTLGPAIGGIVVAAAGSGAAFVATTAGFVPMLAVLYGWPRRRTTSHLPPERLGGAVRTGVRYVAHSPQIMILLARTVMAALAGASVTALIPMVVRRQLHGDARVYGLMLACFGVGGIISAMLTPRLRRTCDPEWTVRVCLLGQALAMGALALSRSAPLTGIAMVLAGATWMVASVHFNVGVQLSSPRWVAGRVLAIYQATITAGTGVGAWIWGVVAARTNLETPYLLSAVGMLVTLAAGLWLRVPRVEGLHRETAAGAGLTADELQVDGRSGPVVLSLEYRVRGADARRFQDAMQDVRRSRLRNGARDWLLSRDVADPDLWIEQWRHATWHDYLRHRDQVGVVDRTIQESALAFHIGPEPPRLRRLIQRPFGSEAKAEPAAEPTPAPLAERRA